jgi:hypothetical protein
MRDRLRRLLRRPRAVLVDAEAWQQLCELAVFGDAIRIVEEEERRWLLLDSEEGP